MGNLIGNAIPFSYGGTTLAVGTIKGRRQTDSVFRPKEILRMPGGPNPARPGIDHDVGEGRIIEKQQMDICIGPSSWAEHLQQVGYQLLLA